ncbi:MAG: hypothetical protein PHN16_02580 [Candidatus Omnitrophica bacterium]|nr:hypothetical protein [Candidatus Omnitrophota bacterium]
MKDARKCKTKRGVKKAVYEKPMLKETQLDTPEATNYLAAIFVGTALAGCTPAKS